MPVGFRSINGLNNARIAGGLSVSEIPGDGGAGPLAFIIIISVSGLTPGEGQLELTSPTTIVLSAGPADGNGNISVTCTWVNSGNDIDFNQSGGGTGAIPDGFWGEAFLIRGTCSVVSSDIAVDIQFSSDSVIDYAVDLTDVPDNPTNDTPNWDGDKGDVLLEFDYDNSSGENPDSIAIVRDGVVVASVPWYNGTTHYTYTDIVFAAGDYDYEFFVYKYPFSRSAATSPITVSFGGAPSITMTMSGGITFGGAATVVFLGNPTGTYTIIKDKTNDTLYNTDDDVAIPNPFIVTGFFPQ